MIVDVIADLHGYKPYLPGGELLIVAGDLTARDTETQHAEVALWLEGLNYERIVVIAGNHDTLIQEDVVFYGGPYSKIEYLQDEGTEFKGYKIWGSPWTLWFHGINPKCKAFTGSESVLEKKFRKIPEGLDILITHGPMHEVLDENRDGSNCGSTSLRQHIDRAKPRFHIFGHIHEQGAKEIMHFGENHKSWCMNCSYVDEFYKPVHSYLRLEIL